MQSDTSDPKKVTLSVRVSDEEHIAIKSTSARSRCGTVQNWASTVIASAARLEEEITYWKVSIAKYGDRIDREDLRRAVSDAWFDALAATGAIDRPCPDELARELRSIGELVVDKIFESHGVGSATTTVEAAPTEHQRAD